MAEYELLRKILQDELHGLWQGVRTGSHSECLILLPRSDPASRRELDLLAREHDLLDALRVSGVLRPLEMTEIDGRAAVVLENFDGQPAGTIRGLRADVGRWLPIAIRLSTVLAELHRLGVTLRSLTPDNVLVHESSGDVGLVLLSFAVRGTERAGEPLPLHLLRDRLPYLAPEQTGRTNRRADHRADLYALGVTLYELLVGRAPFAARDPLEILHAHVARQPPDPGGLAKGIPATVSAILLKLLAKNPDYRYWSAAGLREDLEECERQWRDGGTVTTFPLGSRDVPDRLIPLHRLYGRGSDAERLRSAFEAAAAGPSSCVLVSGYSGIGKTSLIDDLAKPVALRRGAFASGKCDLVVRNLPYAALLQAFRALLDRMLARNEEELADWRRRLESALGANLSVLAELMPEIRLVVGDQPRPTELGPNEAQNRFRAVIRAFVGTIAGPDHPVVLFLDDLHWIDNATIELLEPLLTDPEIRSLFLVGAYRDNEVAPDHPLLAAVARLKEAHARIEMLSLGPLALPDLSQLLSDLFREDAGAVEPLARVVLEKTGGNPFFAIDFLRTLQENGLLFLDEERRRWTFRIEEIHRSPLTENVADLVGRRIRRLPDETRRALSLAACIGNAFDADLLGVAAEMDSGTVVAHLAPAVGEGVLVPAPEEEDRPASYAFLHDRVQQSAYALIPEGDRPEVHARVGRLLWQRWGDPPPEDRLFELVHHLNLGGKHLDGAEDRARIARLGLVAARRAKSATAYREALAYALAGIDRLDGGLASETRDLAWSLHLEAAECEYLCGNFEGAEDYFGRLLAESRDRSEQVEVRCLMTMQYENMTRYADALRATREGLALFGLDLPETAEEREAAVTAEVARIETIRAGRPIESLVDLPRMTDPAIRSLMRLLMTAWAPTYLSGSAHLTRLLSALMVRLSLEHGNTEESAYGYVTHAITVGPVLRDYETSYEWGRLALAANERFDDRRLRAKIHQQFQAHVNPWRQPLETSIPHAREAQRSGLESGDFTYAGYGAFTESWSALLLFRDLDRFVAEQASNLAFLERIRMSGLADVERATLAFARALQGGTASPVSLAGEEFDEDGYEATYRGQPFFLAFLSIFRLWLALHHEDLPRTAALLEDVRRFAPAVQGTVWAVVVEFLEALAIAALSGPAPTAEATEAAQRMSALQESLDTLAANAPENWAGFAGLVEAERHRIAGRSVETLAACEKVIEHAKARSAPGLGALAAEIAGRCCIAAGIPALARRYLLNARESYARWGATAKVAQLDRRHAELLAKRAETVSLRTPSSRPAPAEVAIDVDTFAKAASAIAGEFVLETLIQKLVRIAIENAGAERGMFLRVREGRLEPVAEGHVDQPEVALATAAESGGFCDSVVQYVRKTGLDVVIADAVADHRWASDPHVLRTRPRSILCVPILHQGASVGLLYLENNLGPDAFSDGRVRVIRALSGQMAISLENARLWEETRQEVERRTLVEQDLKRALEDLRSLKNRLQAENAYLQEEIHRGLDEVIGDSPPMRALLERIERVAPTGATVLIEGETGTGKELLARAIHRLSPRRDRPLTRLNCGAIPAGLVESELFGHVKGAFTGAVDRRVGRFELADGGTIFLDEVGELPPDVQVKLLRVLQELEFEPVGSDRTVRVDVRVIAATNRDLQQAVREGRFRSDLYYRLSVVPVQVPPLRARPTDIPKLVAYFVDRACRETGRPIESIPDRTMEYLVAYAWPGNVRELQNVVERAVILSRSRTLELDGALLPAAPRTERPSSDPGAALPGGAGADAGDEVPTLEESERRHILDALTRTGGVIEGPNGAAILLAIHPNTLRSRMKKLRIERPRDLTRPRA